MTTAYIGLGSNLGDREKSIQSAVKMLAEIDNIKVLRVSDIIKTAPLGGMNQPEYRNAVAEIETSLSAKDLHKRLVAIETAIGREKIEKWASRIIDLDLLLFGADVINYPDLTIPHPQMHLRSFVIKGICQLNSDLLHPILKEPATELAKRLNGQDFVFNPNVTQLISIAGIIGVGKTTLAKKLSNLLGCKLILEPYDKNPFLPQVYAGKKELALDSQLYFLTSRTTQLNRKVLATGQLIISDYIFDKELIYARSLLNPRQLSLYEKTYPPFAVQVVRPVLVIYLRDSTQRCLERIHRRNRPYEQKIEPQFLENLDSDYRQLFKNWKTSPLIRLSMSDFNYMDDNKLQHLANQIKSYTAVGRT
jgi:2-amino-4-hydroxy-6-hydroxymethyldihydropteridine diphosphokinase